MNMRKNTICVLTAAIFLAISGTGSANKNPFADVPQGDWSYNAIESLIHKGMVRGYDDTSLPKDQILTRNEMAVLVAKAMSKDNMADADTKVVLDNLAKEYSDELQAIGVYNEKTPGPVVKENKLDRLSFDGTGRIRFDKGNTSGLTVQRGTKQGSYTPNSHINIDINYAYKINDTWSLHGENEYGRQLNYGGENETLQHSVFEQMYLAGPVSPNLNIKAGRFSAYSPQGLVYDDKVTGAQISFGNVVKTTLEGGLATSTDDDTTVTIDGIDHDYKSGNYQAALFDVPLSKISNMHLGYYRIGGNILQHQSSVNDYVNYYTVGFDSTVADNLNFCAVYAKSDAKGIASSGITSTDQKAYLMKLTYKAADLTKPKSFDVFAMYRKSPQLASYSNTDDWCQNVKGIRIGMDYVFTKNMGLTTWYTWGKDVDTKETNDMYRVQWNFLL